MIGCVTNKLDSGQPPNYSAACLDPTCLHKHKNHFPTQNGLNVTPPYHCLALSHTHNHITLIEILHVFQHISKTPLYKQRSEVNIYYSAIKYYSCYDSMNVTSIPGL